MLDTCLHKLGHFFVGELHFTGKDFLLDAGREVVRNVDASCIVAGTENRGTADTVFFCDSAQPNTTKVNKKKQYVYLSIEAIYELPSLN